MTGSRFEKLVRNLLYKHINSNTWTAYYLHVDFPNTWAQATMADLQGIYDWIHRLAESEVIAQIAEALVLERYPLKERLVIHEQAG